MEIVGEASTHARAYHLRIEDAIVHLVLFSN